MTDAIGQLELFAHVAAAYADADEGRSDNERLYRAVVDRAGLPDEALTRRTPVGVDAKPHNVLTRAIRWHQQTLKHAGALRRVEGERGVWELVQRTPQGLHVPLAGVRLVAFETNLGVAIWGDCHATFGALDETVHLVVTSPPYPLRKPRAYGPPPGDDYVAFIVRSLEPIVRRLVPGGSVCLNLSNDCFEPGSPARSVYCERVLLALHDRLGLSLMDRLIWHNPSKAPGPVRWASMARNQLNVAWEPIFWFTNDPSCVRADNRGVLEPHTERHLSLIAAGGTAREASYSDGAYRLHPGRFGNATPGRIPRNVLVRGHTCPDSRRYRHDAVALGLPVHGAVMPISIPDFLIRFLSEPGDLVVDPFGGTCKTGRAAEALGRRWIVTETVLEYLRASGERFRNCSGFEMASGIEQWPRKAA